MERVWSLVKIRLKKGTRKTRSDRMEMDALLQLNLVLGMMVLNMRAAMQHGWNNPIMVEDDKEVVDTAPVEHTLIEIIEETPEPRVVDDNKESPKV